MQEALRANRLQVSLSPTAAKDIYTELMWTTEDLLGFMQCLHGARYRASEWGLPAGSHGAADGFPADVYVMGYNRIAGEEGQRRVPWIYFKFAIRPNIGQVLILSAHPER